MTKVYKNEIKYKVELINLVIKKYQLIIIQVFRLNESKLNINRNYDQVAIDIISIVKKRFKILISKFQSLMKLIIDLIKLKVKKAKISFNDSIENQSLNKANRIISNEATLLSRIASKFRFKI